MARVQSVLNEAKEMATKTNAEYDNHHKHSTSFDTAIKQQERSKRFQQARAQGVSQDVLSAYNAGITGLRSAKKEHAETSGYGQQTMLVSGAEEMV